VVRGGFAPGVLGHQCRSYSLELGIIEDTLWTALNVYGVAGIEKGLGGGGSEGGAVLESLACGGALAIADCRMVRRGAYTQSGDEE
jgi:hypothetical protein